MASGLLPKSPVSSSLCDEVPHIFIPKSHLEPREFLISSAKRLFNNIGQERTNCTACFMSTRRSGAILCRKRHRGRSNDHALPSFITSDTRPCCDDFCTGLSPGSAVVGAGWFALLQGQSEHRFHHSRSPTIGVPVHPKR